MFIIYKKNEKTIIYNLLAIILKACDLLKDGNFVTISDLNKKASTYFFYTFEISMPFFNRLIMLFA